MAHRLTSDWLAERFAGAPAELLERVSDFVGEVAEPTTPAALSRAASRALASALGRAVGRAAALDVLAADALVTVALAAQVETDPKGLEQFARDLRAGAAGIR